MMMKMVKQEGSIEEYIEIFDYWVNMTYLLVLRSDMLDFFLNGLKDDLKILLVLKCPQTLQATYMCAEFEEISPKYFKHSSVSFNGLTIQDGLYKTKLLLTEEPNANDQDMQQKKVCNEVDLVDEQMTPRLHTETIELEVEKFYFSSFDVHETVLEGEQIRVQGKKVDKGVSLQAKLVDRGIH
ncbi:hypothetical protein SLEP1_g34510 [Rubroshorea leprosula]|uniref:Retrotransposon gag domain-containing protein n=1 Tax=Rubroshorea leprosula TaxID=152421 RepID=A0AAV5KKE2_9ROSI|nr:hypothetical protein SLEP1_g34510 [Rubroshorea leprosula]